ncbi:3'-5' exonuclease [Magnetospirillum sp. UT-4]|uniref:3'-5' exonuclease n=1 Tax=Magnetospirillum sp. UT-4 TaxID=2681467 RepID=UPI00137EB5C2
MTAFSHVMVDLETMGAAPGCAILSIGAVAFDPVNGRMGPDFYTALSLDNCVTWGLTIEPGTVLWWMRQSEAARNEAMGGDQMLPLALADFAAWFSEYIGAQYFWCHGATFDAPILSAAYQCVGRETPWKFWDVRDTRTLYDLARVKPDRAIGTHHNALDDARAQAMAVVEAYRRLGLVPTTCAGAANA